MTTRTYPYGYGEAITFSEVPDKTFTTESEDVFIGEYTVASPFKNGSFRQISAIVKQKYYVDKKSRNITKIETDLTDLNRMRSIINYLTVNDYTLEEAQKISSYSNK